MKVFVDLLGHHRPEQSSSALFMLQALVDEVLTNVAHAACIAKIVPHKLFDRQQSIVASIAQPLRYPDLFAAFESIVCSIGMKVHLVANPQQKLARGQQLS